VHYLAKNLLEFGVVNYLKMVASSPKSAKLVDHHSKKSLHEIAKVS
jgi:hypothetical protein